MKKIIATQEQIEAKELKTQEQTIKAFKDLFELPKEPISEEEALKEDFVLLSAENFFMCITKTEKARKLLREFAGREESHKIFPFDYYGDSKTENESSYSLEYLLPILKCFKYLEGNITLSLKGDYPLKVEGKDFIFILAPRMEYYS